MICCCNIDSSSKHCKECDRCVRNFDHHCNWVNNCIGDENYKIFFVLLILVFYMLSLNISLDMYAFLVFINRSDEEEIIMNANCKIFGFSLISAAIITIISACLNLIMTFNISYLIIMHIWLRCKGLTTYQYITSHIIKEERKSCKENNKTEHDDNGKTVVPDSILEIQTKSKLTKSNQIKVKKSRNKILPAELFKNFSLKELKEKNIKYDDDHGKIYFEDKNFQSKIFKPILENIYNNTESKSLEFTKQFEKNYKNSPKNVIYFNKEYINPKKNIDNDTIKIVPLKFQVLNKNL